MSPSSSSSLCVVLSVVVARGWELSAFVVGTPLQVHQLSFQDQMQDVFWGRETEENVHLMLLSFIIRSLNTHATAHCDFWLVDLIISHVFFTIIINNYIFTYSEVCELCSSMQIFLCSVKMWWLVVPRYQCCFKYTIIVFINVDFFSVFNLICLILAILLCFLWSF